LDESQTSAGLLAFVLAPHLYQCGDTWCDVWVLPIRAERVEHHVSDQLVWAPAAKGAQRFELVDLLLARDPA
jgi:hypothetical protein